MADKKRSLVWIFVVLAVAIIGILLYVYRDKLFGRTIEDPNKTNDPLPPGSATTKWIPEKDPYAIGMYGSNIAKLQKALGFSVADQDGKFGTQTKDALVAKSYAVPLSEADYKKIVNPPSTGGSNFEKLRKALGTGPAVRDNGSNMYVTLLGENKKYAMRFYDNGRFFFLDFPDGNVIKRGTYIDGGKKLVVDGGKTFTASSGVYNTMSQLVDEYGQ